MRNVISPKLKLKITLRYLATRNSYKSLQYLWRISQNRPLIVFCLMYSKAIYGGFKKYIQVKILKKTYQHVMYNV